MKSGEKLKKYFKGKGLNNNETAIMLNYSPSEVSQFLTGNRAFNFDFISRVTTAFPDVDWNHVLKDETKEKDSHQIIAEIENKLEILKENLTRK